MVVARECSHGHSCLLAFSAAASTPVPSQNYVPLSSPLCLLFTKQYNSFALFRDRTSLELVIPFASLAHSESQ